jgi:DEAD/DEAH box helicase domain-containing protein
MLPATLAHEVRKQVLHYLQATFNMRDPAVEAALAQFFNDPEHGLFKGPWLQMRRPFRHARGDHGRFFDLPVPFTPFKHQQQAWERLTSKDQRPKHTLITTGTGSGKTECFLYPILDWCLRAHRQGDRDGIKAIVLYPMNALAADQAGRFAEEVLRSDLLSYDAPVGDGVRRKARVRVGLYTGRMQPGQEDRADQDAGTYREMQVLIPDGAGTESGARVAWQAITNREVLQDDPPDVLLTNYRMLDFLLMRPQDQRIWRFNTGRPDLLRYLVLDELHTYDGAQGADVACLLRRLKERLAIPRDQLCVVGTSATIAGGEDESRDDPLDRLCHFAESLFEESIRNDAVILEDRYSIAEIIRPPTDDASLADAAACVPAEGETAAAYARRLAPLFGAPGFPVMADDRWLARIAVLERGDPEATFDAEVRWGLALGEWLRAQPLFHALLNATKDGAVLWNELLRQLTREDFGLREAGDLADRSQLLMAFLALLTQARELRSGRAFPLLPTQVQLWVRELRRIGRLVTPQPVFSWLDEPLPDHKQLPVVHCTECGEAAWVGLHDPDHDSEVQCHVQGFVLDDDVRRIYDAWGFDRPASPRLVILSPWAEGDDPFDVDGQLQLPATRYHIAPTGLVLRLGPGACPLSGEKTFAVKLVHESRSRERRGGSTVSPGHPSTQPATLAAQRVGVRRCPHCQAEDSLMFIGSRAATVASVSIDEVFGSVLNNDPKLLAFTDSVQDASHRAGFFSARTYHFTFRTALQHVIDAAGDQGLPLEQVGERLLDYWSRPEPGRPGSEREVMATLIPPDLREYGPYLDFRDSPSMSQPPAGLRREFIQRLNWQATSEFSLMLTHGRTMELHAGACLGWERAAIERTVAALRSRVSTISPLLEHIEDRAWERWIAGILHRQRERGGLYHPYLDAYARQKYWGKFPFGRVVEGRETYPPAGRYKPRLMVTEGERYHDHLLAPRRSGQQVPWHLLWLRRALGTALAAVDDTSLVDVIAMFLQVGAEAGLLREVHRDGDKRLYALARGAARLYAHTTKLVSSSGSSTLFRPPAEAALWRGAPSLGYRDDRSRYQAAALNDRERYYRDRYRKGALRRVFAHEHTGLLTTGEREALELSFNLGSHADDPNVLTATSTLEMGIDIGDLSTTMLSSIPPSVASYLQRIGRAGRKTGTALVLAVINQRPHDLFFYARPSELLDGRIESPGCWLDASAVLVRQYLAYCFDQAVKQGVLTDIPRSGKQLVEELIVNRAGHIPGLLEWMLAHEAALQQTFLARFRNDVLADTLARFARDARGERLREQVERAAQEFDSQRQLLENARRRLGEQRKKLDPETEQDALQEIEREQRILSARTRKLGDISALEVLIEHGLLPNYAFPERGVRFSGTTYNRYPGTDSAKADAGVAAVGQGTAAAGGRRDPAAPRTIELVRSGNGAIRELAPANHFYTHSHVFEIQQLEVGSSSQPLIEEWAVCGQCGHLRTVAEVREPQALPACPQCGYDGPQGQTDIGQHRALLPFHRSQAVSYMEYYDSLSADRGEERETGFYRLVTSFDNTVAQAGGAVADDQLPFGIEYRSAVRMREVNCGYGEAAEVISFGPELKVPEGFEVCSGCGMVVKPGKTRADVEHRRSCPGRRQTETLQREGRSGNAYRWYRTWLYRELRSEAIRLLLPDVEPEDLDTLEACIYLGLRLRFQGNPGHLMVRPQSIPDHQQGITRHYLVLMDAVPGGTGFLKALFQETDDQDRTGEGVMTVLRLALDTLETCACRRLHHSEDDSDGCYRCIRSYQMQHRAAAIQRERGIRLLRDLIAAGERRSIRQALDDINVSSLFGSVLEKRFVERLRAWVEDCRGQWQETLVNGSRGFRFVLPNAGRTGPDAAEPIERAWELERQPLLGSRQGVVVACQPDFMLRCDDAAVKPVAIFTDGFEPHANPGEAHSHLADDVRKRRAILASGAYWVWSLSWDDLSDDPEQSRLDFLQAHIVSRILAPFAQQRGVHGLPGVEKLAANPWQQLQAFLSAPVAEGWARMAHHGAGLPLSLLAGNGIGGDSTLMQQHFEQWRAGYGTAPLTQADNGDWCWLTSLALSGDLLVYVHAPPGKGLSAEHFDPILVALRLGDSPEERAQMGTFKLRWRRFLALFNLFQFAGDLVVFTTSELAEGGAPELLIPVSGGISAPWQAVLDEVITRFEPTVKALAAAGCRVPEVEYYSDELGDELFAELAWPGLDTPIALLSGDQASFADRWQQAQWRIITANDLQARGTPWLCDLILKADKEA